MTEIQNLPVEIMCCVFDKLSAHERRPLHLVCRNWYEMLTTKHYLLQRRLRVDPDNVDAIVEDWLAKFPCITIRDVDASPKSLIRKNFLNSLRKIVFKADVIPQIEELSLESVQSDLLIELFGETCETTRFPNLTRLSIDCIEYGHLSNNVWNFPENLIHLTIHLSRKEEITLVEALAKQLHELKIECTNLPILLQCCDIPDFHRLHTLKLASDTFFPERFSPSQQLGDNFVRTLRRLRSLALVFRHNDFLHGYTAVLQNCQKLKALSIFGADLNLEACNRIAEIANLKRLELLIRIEKDQQLNLWNLEKLRSLHTYVRSLAPIGENLPSLHTIRISNHTIREGRFGVKTLERNFIERYFSHFESIEKLILYDVYLEEDLLLQFPKMKVREMILRCVRTSSLVLDIIHERAPEILDVYFWDCCFLVSPRAKIPSFEALGRLLPRVRISHSSSKIIALEYGQILS
ncbi:uncharacterized protein LOC129745798 [Uranotaenia lowii]|uniref:uncharacterized protein LOC129745798 n=1 Tax=Uranotaenia lowii TaxID=190385 RepID=UPI00247A4394|nr:uncharacterized protein LOC129745798 [Uranotaenia lowii]